MSILSQTMNDKRKAEKWQFNSSQLLLNLFKNLTEQEQNILKDRFGLLGEEEETLKKVGLKYKKSRERIRQIQNKILRKLEDIKNLKELLGPIENRIIHLLEKHGRVMEEEIFLDKLLKSEKDFQENQDNRKNLVFILFYLSQVIERVGKNSFFKSSWCLGGFSFDKLERVVGEAKKILQEKGHPIRRLIEILNNRIGGIDKIDKNTFLSYFEISKEIEKDIFGKWGLVSWPEVTPKRLKDKAYLILKKEKKPLHFEKITELINKQFKKKINCISTVHNELVFDKRFVLVGRGIYALREQGYKPGVVVDVVLDILKKENQPMNRKRLIEFVLKQRLVKRQTISLALLSLTKEGRINKKGREYEIAS